VIWLTPTHLLRRVLICGVAIAIVSRATLFILLPQFNLAPYILPFTRADCLCAGGLLATIWRDPPMLQKLKAIAASVTMALVAPAVVMVYCIVNFDLNRHMYFWGHSLLSAFYFFVVLTVITRRPAILRQPILRGAGSISYALYLFHPLFISLFFILFRRPEAIRSWTDFFVAAGALLASIAFCVLSYCYYETPIRRLGHRKQYGPAPGRSLTISQKIQNA
jgi:peptidoglycan/LPS O-acetylase OafA/YrhL